jgi:exopolysaccharide biosynthesis polyprenyl glycosylphosphotransferase
MSQAAFGVPENAFDDTITDGEPAFDRLIHAIPHPTAAPAPRTPKRVDWTDSYRTRLFLTDAAIVTLAMSTSALIDHGNGFHPERVIYILLSGALWYAALSAFDSRNPRSVGTGVNEYKALIDATVAFLGVLVIAALAFNSDIRRGDLIPAVPLGFVALVAGRWVWRQWLARQRKKGRYLSRVVLVGSPSTLVHTAAQLNSHVDAGYLVVGSIVPELHILDGGDDDALFVQLRTMLGAERADTVMFTSSDYLTPDRMRRLSWELERGSHRLVLSPSLNDVVGSRIQTQPVAGLPLIHIEAPTYTGPQRVAKRAIDLLGSAVLLVIFAPLLIVVAVCVKVGSRGPVFYVQERVGHTGSPFGILKFRSMVHNADAKLGALLLAQGTDATPLFKIRSDPRVTRVGALIRRYSIDELPQLLNVFRGEMSLVGPRPQRPAEVALYDSTARRRLAVRPGMSGLWQVSGRSRLSWQEALRLDLYYIENWSLAADLVILWRTARAVVGSDGAY